MKRIAFLMFALMLMGTMVMAQGARRDRNRMEPQERAKRMTEHMAKEYSLNDQQKKELLQVNTDFMEKMAKRPGAMHHGKRQGMKPGKRDGECTQAADSCCAAKKQCPKMSKEERQKMRQEMKASHEAYKAQLQKIFTKDQYAAYTKKQAEARQKMRDGKQGRK